MECRAPRGWDVDASIFIQVPDGGDSVSDVGYVVEFEAVPVVVGGIGHEEFFHWFDMSIGSDECCNFVVHGGVVAVRLGFTVIVVVYPEEFVHHAEGMGDGVVFGGGFRPHIGWGQWQIQVGVAYSEGLGACCRWRLRRFQ